MSDDLRGVEWFDYDPDTGKLHWGVAFEDGSGTHGTCSTVQSEDTVLPQWTNKPIEYKNVTEDDFNRIAKRAGIAKSDG